MDEHYEFICTNIYPSLCRCNYKIPFKRKCDSNIDNLIKKISNDSYHIPLSPDDCSIFFTVKNIIIYAESNTTSGFEYFIIVAIYQNIAVRIYNSHTNCSYYINVYEIIQEMDFTQNISRNYLYCSYFKNRKLFKLITDRYNYMFEEQSPVITIERFFNQGHNIKNARSNLCNILKN